MPETPAARVCAYRARRKAEGLPDTTRRNRKGERKAWKQRRPASSRNRPFVGCDGEGCGQDELGRQLFMLFRMGERELYTGSRLTTLELLTFICDEPAGSILVGFFFGYDVTMILRDLPPSQQKRLFEPKTFGAGHSPFVWYKEFDIDYLPKNYLRVRRVQIVRGEDGSEKRVAIKGSQRTIYETSGFFQKAFLKVIQEFGIGTDAELKLIADNKNARADFSEITSEIRGYCALECDFLAQLMEKLRIYCADADIRPRTWSGAGKLASALHSKFETPKARDIEVPPKVLSLANMAYYGGRFEITRVGQIKGPVYEYDLKSAYPAAMPELPCLTHGRWERTDAAGLRRHKGLFIAGVQFRAKPSRYAGNSGSPSPFVSSATGAPDNFGQLGGFPVRSKEGHLYWPLQGSGVYWSVEIESAKKLGHKITYKSGWLFHKDCDCKPFDWVEKLYDYRQSIGSSGPGYPIKLGLNSLYGKLAQRLGNGAFANMIWAGLITAITRAKLNEAIFLDPRSIIMLATDAVYSTKPLPLPLGERLGNWEQVELDGLFIVQPGLYWCPAKRKRKSRGLSGRFFEEAGRTEGFEHAWETFRQSEKSLLESDFPKVSVPVPGFIGLKLAISRGKPELAGRWVNDTREISFDYRNKRVGHRWDGACIVTKPKMGSAQLVSLPHREFLKAGGAEPWEAARAMLEDQPDYVDLGIPWKD